MTFEQGAIAVIGSLTAFTLVILKIIYDRSTACETHRTQLQAQVTELMVIKGRIEVMQNCPKKTACPFAMEDA
jgi:hypothetical protein